MINIPNNPWENMNLTYDSVMSGSAFLYFEKQFIVVYEKFENEREEILKQYDIDHNWDRFQEIQIYNHLFTILGCAMIELWINSFGIHLLTSEYYHKNVERIGIIEKIKVLTAIHKHEIFENENETIKNIRKLFDERNSFIHPKGKQFNQENMAEFAFCPENTSNEEYLFVKTTLSETHKLFKDIGIIESYIDWIDW
jgi:hypothetical protein